MRITTDKNEEKIEKHWFESENASANRTEIIFIVTIHSQHRVFFSLFILRFIIIHFMWYYAIQPFYKLMKSRYLEYIRSVYSASVYANIFLHSFACIKTRMSTVD